MTENISLIKAAQDGEKKALEKLIEKNTGLVHRVVKRFTVQGFSKEAEDLFQVGVMGLIKAVRNFDPERGTMYSTYAYHCIIGEIRNYLHQQAPVKISKDLQFIANTLRNAAQEKKQKDGWETSLSELAKTINISLEEAIMALESTKVPLQIDNLNLGYEGIDIDHLSLRGALSALDMRSRILIYWRYFRGYTQARTGQKLGMSQVHVSRVEKKALEQMRKTLK